MSKAAGLAEIGQSLEVEIGRNVHELKRIGPALAHQENAAETSADDLGLLLRTITERSTFEIASLIDELHSLRTRLETDGDLIERAIARHSQLSQGALQLTMTIADNVKRLANSDS